VLGLSETVRTAVSTVGVAARVTTQLLLAKQLGDSDWNTLNVTDATNPAHILEANRLIERRLSRHNEHFTRFLRNEHIDRLHAHWVVAGAEARRTVCAGTCSVCSQTHPTSECPHPSQWMRPTNGLGTSLDQGYLQFAKPTRAFFAHPRHRSGNPLEQLFVTQVINTDDGRLSGYHWFTVAVSIRLIPEPVSAQPCL